MCCEHATQYQAVGTARFIEQSSGICFAINRLKDRRTTMSGIICRFQKRSVQCSQLLATVYIQCEYSHLLNFAFIYGIFLNTTIAIYLDIICTCPEKKNNFASHAFSLFMLLCFLYIYYYHAHMELTLEMKCCHAHA